MNSGRRQNSLERDKTKDPSPKKPTNSRPVSDSEDEFLDQEEKRRRGKNPCDTSDQLDSMNRICGGRAATVRPFGREPAGAAFYSFNK